MNITSNEYEKLSLSNSSWKDLFVSRCGFWPELVIETSEIQKRWFVAKLDSFEFTAQRNFWILSKQYYALARSLFTLGHPNQILMPYKDDVSSNDDEQHQLELRKIISNGGWSFVQFLHLAHMSCELGLKSFLLHSCSEASMKPGFPRTHDLEKLFNLLGESITQDIKQDFQTWARSHSCVDLDEILHGSGDRFLLQRYGDLRAANSQLLGTIDLSRFLHSYFT